MPRPSFVLIQKPQSPFKELLAQALEEEIRAEVLGIGGLQNGGGGGDDPLVVWDIHDHQPEELEALTTVLTSGQVEVVLVCGPVGARERELLQRLEALGLLAQPASALAAAAALELAWHLHLRFQELRREREAELRKSLDRDIIERAKYTLMTAAGLDEQEAMRRLQKHSRDTNQRLVEVARAFLAAHRGIGEED